MTTYKTIPDLPAASTARLADLLEISQGGFSRRVTVDQLQVAGGFVRTPEMHGAIGDGVADDTAAVQACVVAGGVQQWTRHYRVTAQITATVSVKIIGYGGKLTHDTSAYTTALYAETVTGFEVHGLEIDGRRSLKPNDANPQSAYGIKTNRCSRVIIRDCYVHDCFEHGIDTATPSGETDPNIADIYVHIEGNFVFNNGRTDQSRGYGIWNIGRARNITIANNICIDNVNGGIFVDDAHSATGHPSYNVSITGNVVVAAMTTSSGIGASGTTNLTITGNVVDVAGSSGISLSSVQTGEPCGYANISGNRARSAVSALRLVDVIYVNVVGNHFQTTGTGTDYITCNIYSQSGPELHHVSLHDNLVLAPQTAVAIDGYSGSSNLSHDVTISGNCLQYTGVMPATTGAAVWMDCPGINNIVRDNEMFDFYESVRASTSTNSWPANCFDNHIKGSAHRGIVLGLPPGGMHHTIIGNIVEGSVTCDLDLHVSSNVPATIIRNNTFKSTTAIDAAVPNATAEGNYPRSLNNITKTNSYTVTNLTTNWPAATAGAGARAFVTDASVTTFMTTVAGGGANAVPVVSDGTNWKIG